MLQLLAHVIVHIALRYQVPLSLFISRIETIPIAHSLLFHLSRHHVSAEFNGHTIAQKALRCVRKDIKVLELAGQRVNVCAPIV